MFLLHRSPSNPVLQSNPKNMWESYAVFNGSIIKEGTKYYMFYRAMGEEKKISDRQLRVSVIGKATSDDGVNFGQRSLWLKPYYAWEKYGCEDPRVNKIDNQYLVFYTALANYPPSHLGIRSAVAFSPDLKIITHKELITPFNSKAMTMFPEKINGKYTVLLTVDSDKFPSYVAFAQFSELSTLCDRDFWLNWYKNRYQYTINLKRVNSDHVEVGAPPLKTKDGWLLIYSYIKHYTSNDVPTVFRIEAILLDFKNPQKMIGRIEEPLLIPQIDYEQKGQIENIVFPSGAILEKNQLRVYYGAADSSCALAEGDWNKLRTKMEINAPYTLKANKFPNNPLLKPMPEHSWENKGVFNAGAIKLKGQVYILYRALSEEGVSNVGLAISKDGYYIDERLEKPIYPLKSPYELPRQPGTWSGVEDVRVTQIEDTLYMCFTAFDGQTARLGISSIKVEDFLARNWTKWTETKIISPPETVDKDGALFPEKINGKYVFFHRLEPNIVIDMVDDLDFLKQKHLRSRGIIAPRSHSWDGVKIGINGPPIKTKAGWLVFYHGISKIDSHYRISALLLDLKEVTKVIGRADYPILEPEAIYEKEGIVNNVVFSNGQVVKGDMVIIYYGGADKVLCGAEIDINKLVDYVLKSSKNKYLGS
jgi:beta-1,2-mannobiose phosphorylase / 1,2-beta-oligomannan phosphorylase